jgi:hypothetical protein
MGTTATIIQLLLIALPVDVLSLINLFGSRERR